MKNFKQTGLILLLSMMITGNVYSQVEYSRKYRVVAYKKNDPSVFSISNEIEIVPAMSLYIPNSFTPNGDGLNDTFGVSGEAIKDFSMQIFNRWGQLVFETADANQRWDGTFKGEKVPDGSYVYKVIAKSPQGLRHTREGQVNLIF